MSDNDNKKYGILFILTVILAVICPIALLFALNDYLMEEFNPEYMDDDSFYWLLGLIVVLGLFALLCAYMVYNKAKNNVTIRSKLMAIIMLPILIFGTTFSFIYYGFSIVPEDRGPFLSWMDDPTTTMTVSFERKISGNYELYYGASEISMDSKTAFMRSELRVEDGYYHYSVELSGLTPDTKYFYQIPGFADNPIPFKTAPAGKSAKYKFMLYGDSREDNKIIDNQHIPLTNQLINQMDITELSFAINTGDLARIHDGVNLWNLHFTAIKDFAKTVPYFVASGNHEWNDNDNWNFNDQPALDIQDFPSSNKPSINMYSLDEVSFSFAVGDVFFIFIGYPHAGSGNAEYLAWLEQQLAIGENAYEFTFVSLHRPPFDDREGESSDDNEDIIKSECPLFHEYHVDAVLCGHNHVLAHQNITWDGDSSHKTVTYLIAGGGGAPPRSPQYGTWDNEYGMGFRGKTIYCKQAFHYYIVEIDGVQKTATFTAYELGGEILESFTLKAN